MPTLLVFLNSLRQFSVVSCLVLAAAPGVAHAQIVTWDITGTRATDNNPRSASTLDALLASATLGHGSGTTPTGAPGFFGGTSFFDTSMADAIANNRYLRFTLTPSSGNQFSITSVTVNLTNNFTGTLAFSLLSSVTGFTTSDSLWTGSATNSATNPSSIALSSVSALQNVTSATEFRIYGYVTSGSGGQMRIYDGTGSDLSVFGATSAVPEPSTYAVLVGLAALGAVVWRRRTQYYPH